jgi:hypothetical protein
MPVLRYVELKTGYDDNGPAWIARVSVSRSSQTTYFNGHALKRNGGHGFQGNYYDLESRDEYWISGVKRKGSNRHWAGSGKVMIEETAVSEYLALTRADSLDAARFIVIAPLPQTDIDRMHKVENTSYRTQTDA